MIFTITYKSTYVYETSFIEYSSKNIQAPATPVSFKCSAGKDVHY